MLPCFCAAAADVQRAPTIGVVQTRIARSLARPFVTDSQGPNVERARESARAADPGLEIPEMKHTKNVSGIAIHNKEIVLTYLPGL